MPNKPNKEEYMKNFYKRKTYEKKEKERREAYLKKKAYERCEAERKEKAKNVWKEVRQESLCTYGNYKNNMEKAFHNCFVREKNFKGYINEFREVIENSFKDDMNWDNYGKWEIDHVIPLAKGGEHGVNNIQALWKKENRSKGSKIINIIFNNIIKKNKKIKKTNCSKKNIPEGVERSELARIK
jgi:HNH endonuclease